MGKITEAKAGVMGLIKKNISPDDVACIGDEPILVELDEDGGFDLPIGSSVFEEHDMK